MIPDTLTSIHVVNNSAYETRYRMEELVVSPPPVRLCRIPHDIERDERGKFVLGKRDGKPREKPAGIITNVIPEPFRSWPDQTIPVKNYPALLSLHYALNPEYTRLRADQLLGTGLCWCNGTWGVYSAAIITGGNVLEVERVEGGRVYFKSILISDPAPTLQKVYDDHLYQIGTSINALSGDLAEMTRPNGYGTRSKVRMLVVREKPEPLWLPEDEIHLLPAGFEPPSAVWLS